VYPREGTIRLSADTDLTSIGIDRVGTIDVAGLHGKNNHDQFEGNRTRGAPVATTVRGKIVMRAASLVAPPRVRMVRP